MRNAKMPLVFLTGACMLLSMVGCSSDDGASGNSAAAQGYTSMSAGSLFDDSSLYYAFDPESQSVLSVREGNFKFMSATSGYKHDGHINAGVFYCDVDNANDVVYEILDNDYIHITADGQEYKLKQVTDGEYSVNAQIIGTKCRYINEPPSDSNAAVSIDGDTTIIPGTDPLSSSSVSDTSSYYSGEMSLPERISDSSTASSSLVSSSETSSDSKSDSSLSDDSSAADDSHANDSSSKADDDFDDSLSDSVDSSSVWPNQREIHDPEWLARKTIEGDFVDEDNRYAMSVSSVKLTGDLILEVGGNNHHIKDGSFRSSMYWASVGYKNLVEKRANDSNPDAYVYSFDLSNHSKSDDYQTVHVEFSFNDDGDMNFHITCGTEIDEKLLLKRRY